jgi:DNA-binding LacI/PurR family transcriptional regulator
VITLSDIAKRAEVSVATVSLALRGKPVRRSTAERVRKIAEAMGYRPNPLLASLATKRFRSAKSTDGMPLAIFDFPSRVDSLGGRHPYRPLDDMIVSEARELGYAPKIHNLLNTSKTRSLFHELYHQMVQGVIISGSMDMSTFGRDFDWSHFSVVACARYHASLPFHTVRPNIFKSVKMAFHELRSLGYERIGFAMGRHDQAMEDDEARHGAAIAMEYSYLPKRSRLPVYSGSFKEEAPFIQWVKRCRPDAVIGFNALNYWHLRDNGYRIPEDIGFASMHLDAGEELIFCSGLDQNEGGIARQSVLLLDQFIRNKERGMPSNPMDILISSSWRDGKTLRNCK